MDSSKYIGVVLAGGKGTRLRPFTMDIPKPLIKYKDKCLLDYSLCALKKANINDIMIAIGYHKEKIMSKLGNKYSYHIGAADANIFYVIVSAAHSICNKEFAIFLDGDSVLDSTLIQNCILDVDKELAFYDGILARTTKTNTTSNWDFILDENNIITEVIKKSNNFARIFMVIRVDALRRIACRTDIASHQKENQYFIGYEDYLLGWGLILKLLLNNNYRIKCTNIEENYLNINSVNDLHIV